MLFEIPEDELKAIKRLANGEVEDAELADLATQLELTPSEIASGIIDFVLANQMQLHQVPSSMKTFNLTPEDIRTANDKYPISIGSVQAGFEEVLRKLENST